MTEPPKPLERAIWTIWLEDLADGGYEDQRAAATIRELQAERDRLREALEATPSVEQLKAWADWCSGLMSIPQVRMGPVKNPEEVKPGQEWITKVMKGLHHKALTALEPDQGT